LICLLSNAKVDAQHIVVGHQLSSHFPSLGRVGYDRKLKNHRFQFGLMAGTANSSVANIDSKTFYGIRFNSNHPNYTIKEHMPLGADVAFYRKFKSTSKISYILGGSLGLIRQVTELNGVGFNIIDFTGGPDYVRLNMLYDFKSVRSRQLYIPLQVHGGFDVVISPKISCRATVGMGYLVNHSRQEIQERFYVPYRYTDGYVGGTQYEVTQWYFNPMLFSSFNVSLNYEL